MNTKQIDLFLEEQDKMRNERISAVMQERLGSEWFSYLTDEVNSPRFQKLGEFLKQERMTKVVFPPKEEVFNAYRLCQPKDIKVVIIGQDPYINKGEAHGLAFSVKESGQTTPSIEKIRKSIENSIYNGLNLHWDNNLTRWATQGVFLLNSSLTVVKGSSSSHAGMGWENFTKKSIQILSEKYSNMVYLLFGKYAQNFASIVPKDKNLVIVCEHPVYAARQNRDWIFDDCWNKTNKYLKEHNKAPIVW